ncbi:arylsulfatase [Dyadobacter tibetensis]|uniref:arylsulfatase n=1 Tax=Dyadobacter tibetensis TaxID=1211851 RepID=UPI0004722DD9|nr:arylsulfatase [Dyadobacter tibetensis]
MLQILSKICLFILLNLALSASKPRKENSHQPNIILILADDLGIGLLGHEGQKIIKTPNIDRLAEEGMRFTNAYANMLCAPSRASLITGLHDSHRNRFEITTAGIYQKISEDKTTAQEIERAINKSLSPIPDSQVFLGQVAKEQGYKTAQFGKLEWGFATSDYQMQRHGWDYYLGYLDHQRAHGFYPPFLFQNGRPVFYPGNSRTDAGKTIEPETEAAFKDRWDMTGKNTYSEHIFMEGILEFIEKHKQEPFFMFYPTQLPHGPVSIPAVHPDFINDNRLTQIEKEYASMVKLLDDQVGKILDKLDELQLTENTIIIFTSDNGHEIYYAQEGRTHKPYTHMESGKRFDDLKLKYYSDSSGDVFDGNGGRAGMKRSNLEGGIHVPLLVRWPAKIKPKSTTSRLTANYDILPTIAEITGFRKNFVSDGLSFYSTLSNKSAGKEHQEIIYASFTGPTLITDDGWKLRTYLQKQVFELYYLPDDFREEKDLAEKNPKKLAALKKALLKACDGDYNNGLFSNDNNIRPKL